MLRGKREGSGLTIQTIFHLLGDSKNALVSVEALEVHVSQNANFPFVIAGYFLVELIYRVTLLW